MDNDLRNLEAGTYDGALHRRRSTNQENTAWRGQQPVWYPGKSGETAIKVGTEHRANQAVYGKVYLIVMVPIITFEIFTVVTAVTLAKTGRYTEANALLLLFIIVAGAWGYFVNQGLYSRLSNRRRIQIRRGLYDVAAALVVFVWVCLFVTAVLRATFLPLPIAVSTVSNATIVTNTTSTLNSTTIDG